MVFFGVAFDVPCKAVVGEKWCDVEACELLALPEEKVGAHVEAEMVMVGDCPGLGVAPIAEANAEFGLEGEPGA